MAPSSSRSATPACDPGGSGIARAARQTSRALSPVAVNPAGHPRGLERFQHGGAGEVGIERLECARGVHQDRRRALSLSQGVPDQALESPHPRLLKRIADLSRLLE